MPFEASSTLRTCWGVAVACCCCSCGAQGVACCIVLHWVTPHDVLIIAAVHRQSVNAAVNAAVKHTPS